ncbi:hypothetical protein Cgig2_020660 [Carnegiea gigantea]|uniref:Uncharacterized protein n=1 Tax=Carnegiea gigantea TaxID=171969 RepID=A0A9Q1KHS6_9CARY|nr:hypothetical protein Cgig2_020660 [Carnegiea gigantea]
MGMIHLLLCFGDKAKVRSIEVDFLIVDAPMAYNVILGWPTLHKAKAVIASYLLRLQFKANDRSVRKLQGDQRTAREYCLLSNWLLVERSAERGLVGPPPLGKKVRTALPALAEPLVTHMLPLAKPDRPRPEAVDRVEEILLDAIQDLQGSILRESVRPQDLQGSTSHKLIRVGCVGSWELDLNLFKNQE